MQMQMELEQGISVMDRRNYPRQVVFSQEVEVTSPSGTRTVQLLDVSCDGAQFTWATEEPNRTPLTLTFRAHGAQQTVKAYSVRSNGFTMGVHFRRAVNRNSLV